MFLTCGYSADCKVNGNPIGWLQELCMARRWPPPFYETQAEVGLPHERQFTIACHVSSYTETGWFNKSFEILFPETQGHYSILLIIYKHQCVRLDTKQPQLLAFLMRSVKVTNIL